MAVMQQVAGIDRSAVTGILRDSYGRAIRDLRVSLTDRCNFRCFYCLPHGEPPIAPKEQMLSYEEIEYVCDIFVELGIEKLRLTGGEPMMPRHRGNYSEAVSPQVKGCAGSGLITQTAIFCLTAQKD
jgi:cyclic pyranopterin phosphate synthase